MGTGYNVLYGVAAVSANDVWAVGYYYIYNNGSVGQTLVEHWNGTSWSVIPSPNVGASGNYLNGVAAISANDVWAVGYYNNSGINQTLAEHWNGASWSVVASPNVGTSSNVFNGVAAVSATDVWAVGIYYNGGISQTLIEHWNGSAWSVMSSPNVGTGNNILNGVAAVSANDVWAVGYYPNGSVNQTLVEHYASLCGTPTSTPTRTFTPTNTPTITPTGTNTPTNGPTNTPTRTFTPGNTPTNTPTGAATNTPTPTGTVVIVGHVTWQGRPAQPNALQQLPVTFSIGITSTVLNYPNITTDSTGHFTVTVGLYPGSYTSRAIGPKYLANRTVFTVTTATSLSVELGLMKTGDANSDNVITVGDFNILKSTFGKAAGDPGYDGRADFTGDNSVNISDFNLLRGNFGLIGSPPCSNGVCPP